MAQKTGFFEIHIKCALTTMHKGHETLGFTRRGRGHAKIGFGKQRALRNLAQQFQGQISIKCYGAVVRGIQCRDTTVRKRRQYFVACSFQRMRVRYCGNKPVCTFNGHIDIRWQVIRPVSQICNQAACLTRCDQFVAFCIATDGGQQSRHHAEACKRHCDVHGHATRQARNAPGNV